MRLTIIAWSTLVLALGTTTYADQICRSRSGVLRMRATCKKARNGAAYLDRGRRRHGARHGSGRPSEWQGAGEGGALTPDLCGFDGARPCVPVADGNVKRPIPSHSRTVAHAANTLTPYGIQEVVGSTPIGSTFLR